ncbi:MAG: hypothetical protein ACKV2T_27440 [Kofleriaceae bacterium]
MKVAIVVITAIALAACGGTTTSRRANTFRDACAGGHYWTGTACAKRAEVQPKLAVSKEALEVPEIETATAALAAVRAAGPLAHDANISLWQQLGIAAAFVDKIDEARAAFTQLLALDPGHFLSYELSPKATRIFEQVRNEQATRGAPAVEVKWANGQRVGTPVPIDISIVSDPLGFLHAATVFVRTRGETRWRATDVPLGKVGSDHQIVVPSVSATKPLSLELYVRAYDKAGNEVLGWADASRPREIPLRYDPPSPWWQKWWVITLASSVVVVGTGTIVYGVTRPPPEKVGASVRFD